MVFQKFFLHKVHDLFTPFLIISVSIIRTWWVNHCQLKLFTTLRSGFCNYLLEFLCGAFYFFTVLVNIFWNMLLLSLTMLIPEFIIIKFLYKKLYKIWFSGTSWSNYKYIKSYFLIILTGIGQLMHVWMSNLFYEFLLFFFSRPCHRFKQHRFLKLISSRSALSLIIFRDGLRLLNIIHVKVYWFRSRP